MTSYIEVVIDSIRVSLMSQQRIVILREKEADRYLPIWIGPYEAEAITIALQGTEVSRPLTHDLLLNVFRTLNARLVRVEVNSLRDQTYFGNIVAELNGETLDIDARPSDALALAVRAGIPILVEQAVMDDAGITPEEGIEPGSEMPPPERATFEPEPEDAAAEERLSVFEDFLEGLDLGDDDDDDDDVPADDR